MWAKYWLAGALVAAAGGTAQAQAAPQAAFLAPAAVTLVAEPPVGWVDRTAADLPILDMPAADAPIIDMASAEAIEPNPFGTTVVGAADLAEMAGGQAVVIAISNHDLDAINRDNTITADTVGSGNVELGANAFSGFNGIGNFVINTGHNNNLQGSLSVNVVLTQ
ncbi:hypothetical protein [Caulobacter sp. 17J65-9]|uniref:hypothetical protein n=1 Tax=Caulobacter sp. 17J65-9 TaxID=2709382 RepID=UPI0013CB9F52|nr:hypothetical protein [Caulobacter sp. 17J65-9]NEX95182.1 hypothetical protein [Caulobacter sp. 17J65-9]